MQQAYDPFGSGLREARFGSALRLACLILACAPLLTGIQLLLDDALAAGGAALGFAALLAWLGQLAARRGSRIVHLVHPVGILYAVLAAFAFGRSGLALVFPVALIAIACVTPGRDRGQRTVVFLALTALMLALAAFIAEARFPLLDTGLTALAHLGVTAVVTGELMLMAGDLNDDFESRLAVSAQSIGELARTDHLTMVSNRRHLEEQLGAEISRARRSEEPLCVAVVNIDDLKQINAQQGHESGDTVLRITASVMQKALRPYDHIGRWGGGEFVIVMPRTRVLAAGMVCDRLRTLIQHAARAQGGIVPEFTGSFGVVTVDVEATPMAAVSVADATCKFAKQKGGNGVAVTQDRGPELLADATSR